MQSCLKIFKILKSLQFPVQAATADTTQMPTIETCTMVTGDVVRGAPQECLKSKVCRVPVGTFFLDWGLLIS